MLERTTAYLDVSLKDRNGQPAAPQSVSYRIDCLTTGRKVRVDTPATASASVPITLNAEDNAMGVGSHLSEVHRVTVTAVYGPSDLLIEEFDYKVQRARYT